MDPKGAHSFPIPNPGKSFDLGSLLLNIAGGYLGSGGTRVAVEACAERSNCDWFPRFLPGSPRFSGAV